MGESIEISIVSKSKTLYSKMLHFLENYLSINNADQIINVMDNWCYDNIIEIHSLKEAEDYMETKIVTIEKKSLHEYIGVSIEKNEIGYIIECWINFKKEIIGKQYDNLVREIVDFIKNRKSVILCGIGKEISIDFQKEIDVSIKESHNIDFWIVSRQFYIDNGLNKLNFKVDII